MRFLEGVRRFDVKRSVRGYLLSAARNAALDRARRQQVRKSGGEPPPDLASDADGPLRLSEKEEWRAAVSRALSELSEGQREAVRLHLFAGLTHAQVAEQMNIPVATARNRYRYALGHLQAKLGALCHDE